MTKMKTIVRAAIVILMLAGCGDIKDTYDEYTADGETRYIGQATGLVVSPGWERLIVSWENNTDPAIGHVKVKWATDDSADSVLLDRGATTYNITGLGNYNYTVSVTEVSKSGRESLTNSTVQRPYTLEHEDIQTFTRIISNHFIIGDRLILKFIGWQDGIESASVSFTGKDGTPDTLVLTKTMANGQDYNMYSKYRQRAPYYILPQEIDMAKPITLHRRGRVNGCEDLIEFPDYALDNQKSFNADFKEYLRKIYGTGNSVLNSDGEVLSSWANQVTDLDLNCDLNDFDDILNLPNLKSLSFGGHRYETTDGANDADRGQYKVTDRAAAMMVLQIMHELTGVTVSRYNSHYSNINGLRYITNVGQPVMPNYSYYDLKNAIITSTPNDPDGYDSHLERLVDGDPESCWLTLLSTSSSLYTLNFDLGQEVEASGITFIQKHFSKNDVDNDLAPSSIVVYTAAADGAYSQATNIETTYLGRSTGETNVIPFASPRNVRYISIRMQTEAYHSLFGLTFAELGLYK